MFAYPDAQRYRLGVNYTQLPSNRPIAQVYAPYERDGITTTRNYGSDPNYVRSTLSPGVEATQTMTQIQHAEQVPPTSRLGLNEILVEDDDYAQPRVLWQKIFDQEERLKWIDNCADTLTSVPTALRDAVAYMFGKVDPSIEQMLLAKLTQDSHHL